MSNLDNDPPRPRPLRAAPAQHISTQHLRAHLSQRGARSGTSRTSQVVPASGVPTCSRCGYPLREDAFGWLDASEPGGSLVLVPCPECAPAVKARKTQERLRRYGVGQIPNYAVNWTWETLAERPGLDQAAAAAARAFGRDVTGAEIAWTDREKRGLYLHGRIGRGKTSMGICILKDVLGAGISVGYVPLVHYFRALRRAVGRNDTRLADQYERLREEVDVLLLDDFGVERPTGFVLEELYDLIESRAATPWKWTIMTSNLALPDLLDFWIDGRSDATEADRVNCARLGHRIQRHYQLVPVAGENLDAAPSPGEDEDAGDDAGDGAEGEEEEEAEDE